MPAGLAEEATLRTIYARTLESYVASAVFELATHNSFNQVAYLTLCTSGKINLLQPNTNRFAMNRHMEVSAIAITTMLANTNFVLIRLSVSSIKNS